MLIAGFPQFKIEDRGDLYVYHELDHVGTIWIVEERARGVRYKVVINRRIHADCSSISGALQVIENALQSVSH